MKEYDKINHTYDFPNNINLFRNPNHTTIRDIVNLAQEYHYRSTITFTITIKINNAV